MSGEIGMTDASLRRVYSTETYSTRSITLDDDSNSEMRPVVNDDGKKAEKSTILRLGVRKNKAKYDVLTFNDGGGNGDDDDDDFEDNDFDALVGEFFWFLRNKENDRTPINSPRTPRTPRSGGVLTPQRGTSMMSHLSKGSYRPLVYRDTEGASTPPVTPKASGRTYESVPIQVISVSEDIETETASFAPVSLKTSERGDDNTSEGTPSLFDVVEKEAPPYIQIYPNETHQCEENTADETPVISFDIDNDQTSKASVLSKRIEHDDMIPAHQVEPQLDHVDTEEASSLTSKHSFRNSIDRETCEENVPGEASLFSDNVDSDRTSKASASLEGMDHDDVVVFNEAESRFRRLQTQQSSTFSLKESVHDDEKSHLIKDMQMSFVTQEVLQENDPDIKAYEKWVKKGQMQKTSLIEDEPGVFVLQSIDQENNQQSQAHAILEMKGMMSTESTPNKESADSSSMTENHSQYQQYQQSEAYHMWKKKGLLSPEPKPNKMDIEKALSLKANDERRNGKGQISHEPTSRKERAARVASLIARTKQLLGKKTDVASSNKQVDPEECLPYTPMKDPVSKANNPSPESDNTKHSSLALVTTSKSLSEMEPSGTYSTLPPKSAAPGERRVSFDAKFLTPLDTGEESVISVFSNSPTPDNSSVAKPFFALANSPSQSSITHSIGSASEMESPSSLGAPFSKSACPSKPRLIIDSDCENKSRCTVGVVSVELPSDTEPRVVFEAHPTDSFSSMEPRISCNDVSTEFSIEKDSRSSPRTPPPNSASPRKHSTELALLTAFDNLLIRSSDQMEPGVVSYASSSDSTNGHEPTIPFKDTSEIPSSSIDSQLAVSASGADPDGIIFDVPSIDSVDGKEPIRFFDDIASDPTSFQSNSTIALLIESPSYAEPTGIKLDGCSPDTSNGKETRPILDFAQKEVIAPEQNGTTICLIESPSKAEPAGIIFDAPSPDATNEKELRHIFDGVVKDRSSASDPNGTTSYLYKSSVDAEPAGMPFDLPAQDFLNGEESMHIIDDAVSRCDAEPTSFIFDTPPANRKGPRHIFNDTIPDATGSSEPRTTTPPPCTSGISAGPTNSQDVLTPDSSSDTIGTLVRECTRGVKPNSDQSFHPPDSSSMEESNVVTATPAIESASEAAFGCTSGTTPTDTLETITSSSAPYSLKSTDTKETSASIVSSTDSAKGPSNTVVTVLVYSAAGTRISYPNSIYGAEEQSSVIEPPPSAAASGRIIYSPTGTGRRSCNLIIPHLDNPSSTSVAPPIEPGLVAKRSCAFNSPRQEAMSASLDNPSSTSVAPQIEPGLVAKRSCAFNSPRQEAMSARDCTLGASPSRLNIPLCLTSMTSPGSASIVPPTTPNSDEKRSSAFVSDQSEAMSGREPSSTSEDSPRSLSCPLHLTSEETPSSMLIASPTKPDSVEKQRSGFDSPPATGSKQSNPTLANSTDEDESNLLTSPLKLPLKRSNGNFSSILSQWKEKSEHNPNGNFVMSPSKDMTSPRTSSKTPPSRIWSPPGKSKSTTPSQSSSSPFPKKTAEAPCPMTTPARFQTSSKSRTMELTISASSLTRSLSPSQSDEPDVTASAVSSITTNQSKTDDKPACVGSSVFLKTSMQKQLRTEDIPSVVMAPTRSRALSQDKTEDIPSVSSRAWTPSRHFKSEKDRAQSSMVTNEPCSCSCEASSPFSGNDHLVEFFLPKLGMAHTCGKHDPPILIDSDPIALKHILRPWQVEFLKSVDIYRGDQLVKECNASAGTLAGAMRTWRLQNNLSSPKTISCGMALHIWSRTCKYYVRSIRRQMADGLVEVEPPTLSEVMSSFLDKDNGVSVPVERRMSLLTMGEPDSQREI